MDNLKITGAVFFEVEKFPFDGVKKVAFLPCFFLRCCFSYQQRYYEKKQCDTECNNPIYYTTEYQQQQ